MTTSPKASQIPFYIQGVQFYLSDISSFSVEENTFLISTQDEEIHEFTFSSEIEKEQIIQMMTVYVQHL